MRETETKNERNRGPLTRQKDRGAQQVNNESVLAAYPLRRTKGNGSPGELPALLRLVTMISCAAKAVQVVDPAALGHLLVGEAGIITQLVALGMVVLNSLDDGSLALGRRVGHAVSKVKLLGHVSRTTVLAQLTEKKPSSPPRCAGLPRRKCDKSR